MSSNNLLISSLFPHFHHIKSFFFYLLMNLKRKRVREKEDQDQDQEEEEEEGVFLVD